jgi:hypothetical protein
VKRSGGSEEDTVLATVYMFFFQSDLTGWFIDDHDADGWEDTARSWLIAAVVIAVLCAGLMMFYKWLKKRAAANITKRIWSRGQTVLLILIGLVPLFLIMLTLWYATRDYFDVVGVGGLFKGVLFGWLLYLALMLLGHVAGPWRREIL